MPFLGFPIAIERVIYIVGGITIAALAFFIRGDLETGKNETESYIQNDGANGTKDRLNGGEIAGHAEENQK